jgi:hypothetical protein
MTIALRRLQDLIGTLQKNTGISAEALLSEKTLASRLRDLAAPTKSGQERRNRDLLARETQQVTAAVKTYQRLVAKHDFAGASAVMRRLTVTEPSLKEMQHNYEMAADWLMQWKATLINDLNTQGYSGHIIANNTQYTGLAGATADKLKIKMPYGLGVAETDWSKVAPSVLLTISSSFAVDADRQWRCGVFAWAIGQNESAQKLLDAACSAKPSYREARNFFDQTKH